MREVLIHPHPILREKCTPVDLNDETMIALAEEMLTMVGPKVGRGLAAPQIGEAVAIFATCLHPAPAKIYINPIITEFGKETIVLEEGCRSIPWTIPKIERPVEITIEATDLKGNRFTEKLDSWESRVVQHEYDHLSGILNIDRAVG